MKVFIKNVKITKQGYSRYFLIPTQFITNGVIECNKEYDIEIKETSS